MLRLSTAVLAAAVLTGLEGGPEAGRGACLRELASSAVRPEAVVFAVIAASTWSRAAMAAPAAALAMTALMLGRSAELIGAA